MVTEERLLTVPEVAERLQVHANTVRRWLASGRIRGAKYGGDKTGWRVRPSEVERFIRESEEPPK